MFKKYAAALLLGLPVFAFASVPIDFDCTQSVRSFFVPLVQNDLIGRKPFAVDERSINHFKPRFLKPLTVYGMPVVEVFGYADDPLMFINKGGGPENGVYGVVVREGIGNVQAQLNSFNVLEARTYRVDSHATIIICKG